MTTTERLERVMIGCAILADAETESMVDTLKPEMFVIPSHQNIWQAITDLNREYAPTDFITIPDRLQDMGDCTEYLVGCADDVPSIKNWRHYARQVAESWRLRVWEMRLEGAQMHCKAGEASKAREAILTLLDGTGDASQVGFTAVESLESMNSKPPTGILTGLSVIDDAPDDFKGAARGGLTILGASSGQGKTLLMCQVALNMLREGKRVVFGTFEIPHTKLTSRMLRMMSGYSSLRYAEKFVDRQPWAVEDFKKAEDEFAGFDLVYYDPGKDISRPKYLDDFLSFLTGMHESKPVDAFFADYIQKIQIRDWRGEKHERISEVAARLTGVSVALDACGFAAAQIKVQNGEVFMRGSKEIEDPSDMVVYKLKVEKKDEKFDMLETQKARYGKQLTYKVEIDQKTLLHVEGEQL